MYGSKHHFLVVVEKENKSVANAYAGRRTQDTRHERSRVKVQRPWPENSRRPGLTTLCRESSTSLISSSLRSRICPAGKQWHCRFFRHSHAHAHQAKGNSNLQASLINGGPRALMWGILIVVSGALARSASLAEMAWRSPLQALNT